MRSQRFADALLRRLAAEHGTPLYVYCADTVLARLESLRGFDAVRYAVKANSNLALLALLRRAGALVDTVSAGEVERALAAGYEPEQIALTADLFDRPALNAIERWPLALNLGSSCMIEDVARARPGASVSLRVNPGFGHGHSAQVNTGGERSKHGIWHAELPEAVARARRAGLRVRGLHLHIGSGWDQRHLQRVCRALERSALAIGEELDTLSAGGGLPIPYRPEEHAIDVRAYTRAWLEMRERVQQRLGRALRIEVEPGRYLVAEAGVLLAEVRGMKRSGAIEYVLVDAGFHNLIRPALYGAWHALSILGREREARAPRAVAGPLCESADVFTQARGGKLELRELPAARAGDLLCVHDCGAYAASMASNYNTQPLAAEVLVEGGEARLVRRRQSVEQLMQNELELLQGNKRARRAR